MKLLLQRGADLNIKDSDHKNVLHRAAEAQNKEICLEILKLASSLKDERDSKGKLPVDYVTSPELIALFKHFYCLKSI